MRTLVLAWHSSRLHFPASNSTAMSFTSSCRFKLLKKQGVQTGATCSIQKCWELLANNVASVCTGLKIKIQKTKENWTYRVSSVILLWGGHELIWRDKSVFLFSYFKVMPLKRRERFTMEETRNSTTEYWTLWETKTVKVDQLHWSKQLQRSYGFKIFVRAKSVNLKGLWSVKPKMLTTT